MATKETAGPAGPAGPTGATGPVPTPEPTAEHHFNLGTFLKLLLAVAPAVTAPFIKNPNSQAIANTEAGVLTAVLGALDQQK